jgi:hypothetical protein
MYEEFLRKTRHIFPKPLPDEVGPWHFIRFGGDLVPDPVTVYDPVPQVEWLASIMEELDEWKVLRQIFLSVLCALGCIALGMFIHIL